MEKDITRRSQALVNRLEKKLAMKESFPGVHLSTRHTIETLRRDDAFNFPRVSHHIDIHEQRA